MKVWIFVKITAALAVLGVAVFTGMLTYHVTVKPLGGIFSKMIPDAGTILAVDREKNGEKPLESVAIPVFDPSEGTFQKAHELVVMGQQKEAFEKLMGIVNAFPHFPSAESARHIVSQMNLDQIFSRKFLEGKITYEVRPGDSYLIVANRHKTTLDMLMYMNGLSELKTLLPKSQLLILPLNYKLLIEPDKKTLSLWEGTKFLCEYPILLWVGAIPNSSKTAIAARRAKVDGKRVTPMMKNYRGAEKSIQLEAPPLQIFALDETNENATTGIYLSKPDLEELYLLTRQDNEVEIRNAKK